MEFKITGNYGKFETFRNNGGLNLEFEIAENNASLKLPEITEV